MKLPNINGIVKIGKTFLVANRPEILLGAAVTGTVASVILAAKSGYEARGIIDNEREARMMEATKDKQYNTFLEYREARDSVPELTVKEKFQLTWLCYMPATIATIGSLSSMGGLHYVHVKEKKALAIAAMAAVDEAKAELKKTSIGLLTDEEEAQVLEGRADKETGIAHIYNTDDEVEEMYLVRDGKTGRDIWSNKNRIEDAVNEINAVILRQGDCELNLFYSMAGFNLTPDGDDWGWSGELVELGWEDTHRDDGRPVRMFHFRTKPKEGYSRAHA